MRPVTEEGLDKQIALMTQAMFDAVEKADKGLFELAIKKGADPAQRNANGQPLLHVAVRKSVEHGTVEWLNIILPHVQDLFASDKKGIDVFNEKNDDFLMPHRHPEYQARLVKMRRHLMNEFPDINVARAELDRTRGRGLPAGGKILAPKFDIVGPKRIDKPVVDGDGQTADPAAPATAPVDKKPAP